MSNEEMVKVRCLLIEERPKALLIRQAGSGYVKEAWIPKSILEHISKEMPDKNGWRECVITMPLWLAEQKRLI